MKKYPIKLEAYKKGVVWGGTTLKNKYSKSFPTDDLGETWELSVREKENAVIANGEYVGMTLKEYLGFPNDFPLLVKLLDANDTLSVQVHPQKNEMWYVVEAKSGAKIVYGVNESFDKEKVEAAIAEGTVENMLRYVPVAAGDTFFIPSGLVHSICGGIVIAEIQENNDTTYRLYDYNRPQADGSLRELHTEAALKTICNLSEADIHRERYSLGKRGDECIANCSNFTVDKYDLSEKKAFANEDYAHVLCLDGEGDISGEPIKKGDSYFIPRGINQFTIEPLEHLSVIVSSVPNKVS